jgi:hypothetical protein
VVPKLNSVVEILVYFLTMSYFMLALVSIRNN